MLNLQIERLKQLPQQKDEVWQGGLVRMPSFVTGEDEKPYRPTLSMWIAVNADQVSPGAMCRPDEVNLSLALDGLMRFALEHESGGYRPGRIEVRDSALAEYLEAQLRDTGIAVEFREKLIALDRVMVGMAEHFIGKRLPPGALEVKGVTLDRMRGFAEAAKTFYEASPWKHLTDEDLIAIESPSAPRGMRYTTVLGAANRTFGLGFYGKADELWAIRRTDPDKWIGQRKSPMWSLTFGEITRLPLGDVDLWEECDLPVASEHAYPCAFSSSSKDGLGRPDATVLTFLEGLLRALSATEETQIDSGRWTIAIEADEGTTAFTFALPDLLESPDHKELMRRGYMPDRRAMERMHIQMDRLIEERKAESVDEINEILAKELSGKEFDPDRFPPRNAVEQAQDLCYQAFDARGRRQYQLAKQALEVCPDCADGYVLLAERTSDVEEAVNLCRQGVASGERALGAERFEEDAGHFWGITDTRPYMRARFGLAHSLEQLGNVEEAVEHYRELLRLNPGDNQGVRYSYLPCLLRLGRDAEAARFMKKSEDEPTANWAYTRALLAFRLGGDCAAAHNELGKAVKINRFVVDHLHSGDTPPTPEAYSIGSPEEAVICAEELRSAFDSSPGALKWLGSCAQVRPGLSYEQKSKKRRRQKRRR